jgi:hypothetical protein
MTTSKLVKILGGLGAAALMSWSGQALAIEGFAMQGAGGSTGAALGALPPPGIYGALRTEILDGGLKDGSGNDVAVNDYLQDVIPQILYVPNFQIAGAQYAASIIQPYFYLGVAGLAKNSSQGLFNTVIIPGILSWNLGNGLFASASLAVLLPDGYISHQSTAAIPGLIPAGKINAVANIANDFFTFTPGAAVSYLGGGMNLTASAFVSFNTEDTDTKFQSGTLATLDLTALKEIGKWGVGIGATYQKQLSSDSGTGLAIANVFNGRPINDTNITEFAGAGPIVEYNFGPVALTAKAQFGIEAKNGFNNNVYTLVLFAPF